MPVALFSVAVLLAWSVRSSTLSLIPGSNFVMQIWSLLALALLLLVLIPQPSLGMEQLSAHQWLVSALVPVACVVFHELVKNLALWLCA